MVTLGASVTTSSGSASGPLITRVRILLRDIIAAMYSVLHQPRPRHVLYERVSPWFPALLRRSLWCCGGARTSMHAEFSIYDGKDSTAWFSSARILATVLASLVDRDRSL